MNGGGVEQPGERPEDSRDKWIAIDRLCDAYEASLQEGPVERAPFLAGVPQEWRDQLAQELDAIDAAYRDAEETREQTLKAPADEPCSRRLPTQGRLAELATLDSDRVWLGRFEIRKRLGTGATGSVWCARDARLARWVALKVPHATRMMSETTAARFQTEARAAAAITHPNVVPVHEVLIEDGLPILIQQWIDGPSLAKSLKAVGPLDCDRAADWMAQIADAVAAAHAQGIVHRDLKPANVMLCQDRPMVLDFGLASYPEFASGLTSEGTVLGTPAYMSPEQAAGSELANRPAVDLYALGTILYEMLIGAPPFVGKTQEVMQAVRTTLPNPPRSRRPSIPRDLETITLRCLAKSPAARYRSAVQLRDDLRRFLRREPIHARKVSRLETAWCWCRLHPVTTLLASILPLLVLLLAVTLITTRRHRRLTDRAERLVQQNLAARSERERLWRQRHMVQLSRASQELSTGDRTRGLQLLRNLPESVRGWEWRLLNLISHSPSRRLNGRAEGLDHHAPILALVTVPQTRKLVSAARDGTVLQWTFPEDQLRLDQATFGRRAAVSPTVLTQAETGITALAASPDGQSLAWVDRRGQITIWNVVSGRAQQQLSHPRFKRGQALAFSPDSQRLVAVGGPLPSSDRSPGRQSWLLGLRRQTADVANPSERPNRPSSPSQPNSPPNARPRDPFVKEIVRHWDDRGAMTSVAFRDGQTLLTAHGQAADTPGMPGGVDRWRFQDGKLAYDTRLWRGSAMGGLDVHPSTDRAAWCDDVGKAYVLDLSSNTPPRQFRASRHAATQVRFSPPGDEVVVTAGDGSVTSWAVGGAPQPIAPSQRSPSQPDQAPVAAPPPSPSPPGGTPDADADAAADSVRHVRDYRGHEHTVRDAVFLTAQPSSPPESSPESVDTPEPRRRASAEPASLLVTGGDDGRVYLWSGQSHAAIDRTSFPEPALVDATWLSRHRIALTAAAVRNTGQPRLHAGRLRRHRIGLHLRRLRGSRSIVGISDEPPRPDDPDTMSVSPTRYVICARDRLRVFETDPRVATFEFPLPAGERAAYTAACLVDSRHLVAAVARHLSPQRQPASSDLQHQTSVVWFDLKSDGPPVEKILPGTFPITRLKVAPDRQHVFASTFDGQVLVTAAPPTQKRASAWVRSETKAWQAHRRGRVNDFAWLGDRRRLATVGVDGTCKLWRWQEDARRTKQPLADPQTGSPNDAGGYRLSHQLFVSGSPVNEVNASSSGDRIVTVGDDRVIRIWDTESGLELISLEARKTPVVAAEFSPGDRFLMIAQADGRVETIRLR